MYRKGTGILRIKQAGRPQAAQGRGKGRAEVILAVQAEIDRYNTDSVRADKFIELVKRHTEFNEFSASLLNKFVEKIIVHEATKVNGVREQEVEIYLNFIGKFDLPEQEKQRAAILKGTAYEIRPQEAGAAHAAI